MNLTITLKIKSHIMTYIIILKISVSFAFQDNVFVKICKHWGSICLHCTLSGEEIPIFEPITCSLPAYHITVGQLVNELKFSLDFLWEK